MTDGFTPGHLIDMDDRSQITDLLRCWSEGSQDSLDRLFPLVYENLRTLAHARLREERSGHTLNTTALVHEAYLRFVDMERVNWSDRAHFFALSSRIMRHLLVDYGRKRLTRKRGGHWQRLDFDEERLLHDEDVGKLLELDDALTKLASLYPRAAQAIEQRYFGGLVNEETAAVLGVSRATVERDLRFARTWLARNLDGSDGIPEASPVLEKDGPFIETPS